MAVPTRLPTSPESNRCRPTPLGARVRAGAGPPQPPAPRFAACGSRVRLRQGPQRHRLATYSSRSTPLERRPARRRGARSPSCPPLGTQRRSPRRQSELLLQRSGRLDVAPARYDHGSNPRRVGPLAWPLLPHERAGSKAGPPHHAPPPTHLERGPTPVGKPPVSPVYRSPGLEGSLDPPWPSYHALGHEPGRPGSPRVVSRAPPGAYRFERADPTWPHPRRSRSVAHLGHRAERTVLLRAQPRHPRTEPPHSPGSSEMPRLRPPPWTTWRGAPRAGPSARAARISQKEFLPESSLAGRESYRSEAAVAARAGPPSPNRRPGLLHRARPRPKEHLRR